MEFSSIGNESPKLVPSLITFILSCERTETEGRSVILTILGGTILSYSFQRTKNRKLFIYAATAGVMLLLALCETWMVTFWQPDLAREWQRVYANIFAFPLVVYPVRATGIIFEGPVHLVIPINCGRFNLFLLESPEVAAGTPDMVFWFTRTRLTAFQILFSFHLIAILVFLLIVFCFDVLHHYSLK